MIKENVNVNSFSSKVLYLDSQRCKGVSPAIILTDFYGFNEVLLPMSSLGQRKHWLTPSSLPLE